MTRLMLISATVAAVVSGPAACGQDSEEVKRLRDRIELLEAKLKLAEREVQDLKKENEQLKAGGAKGVAAKPAGDGFKVGTKLTGTNRYSMLVDGKRVDGSGDTEITITKRSGKEFTAEFWGKMRTSGVEIQGTIDENNVVQFKVTKTLTADLAARTLVDNWTFVGRLDDGALTGKTSKPKTPQQAYSGEIKLKVMKE